MIRVWEYDVPEANAPKFERIYGADGAWAQLFSSSDGFEGTELFASVSNSGRYLTVDRFRDEASWRRFMVEPRAARLGPAFGPRTSTRFCTATASWTTTRCRWN